MPWNSASTTFETTIDTPAPLCQHRNVPGKTNNQGSICTANFAWEGPFSWLGDSFPDLGTAPQARLAGTYLIGFIQERQFVGFWPGWTGASFGQRFVEHTKALLQGSYEIRESQALLTGSRVDIWPGGWYWARTPWSRQWPTLREFCAGLDEFGPRLRRYLETLCILLAPIEQPRIAQRLEAALIEAALAGPHSALTDPKMQRSPRKPEEPPVALHWTAPVPLATFPSPIII